MHQLVGKIKLVLNQPFQNITGTFKNLLNKHLAKVECLDFLSVVNTTVAQFIKAARPRVKSLTICEKH